MFKGAGLPEENRSSDYPQRNPVPQQTTEEKLRVSHCLRESDVAASAT